MNDINRTSAHISLDHIGENFDRIAERLPEGIKKCAVVKTNGYGHGAVQVASYLESRADFFAVACLKEAEQLQNAGIRKPILILGYCWPEDYEEIILRQIRIPIFKEEDAVCLSETAQRLGRTARVHIIVDTGMSRIGFLPAQDSVETVRRIQKLPGLDVEGIFTHFARADEKDKTYTGEQFHRFMTFIDDIERGGRPIPIHHCANSAASMELPGTWLNMVRIGISLYGIYPSGDVDHETIELKPAMTWKSTIVLIKDLPAGSGIGYNHIRILDSARRVATIPVGYGDGYPRTLSDRGCVLIRGRRAKILGRICMDQMMVDVTDIPDAAEGDSVTLVGCDGDERLPVEELSELSGRFPYEFVCDISNRVPRVYEEGERSLTVTF